MNEKIEPINILLMEDSEGDVRLVQEALKEGKLHNRLFVVRDGVEGMDFLLKRQNTRRRNVPTSFFLISICRKRMAVRCWLRSSSMRI